MIDPIGHSFQKAQVLWSEFLESIRKDVECVNALLKNRFRTLKNPVYFHKPEFIENLFKASCMLHNLILAWDGNDSSQWENVDWESCNPDGAEPDDEVEVAGNEQEGDEDNIIPNIDMAGTTPAAATVTRKWKPRYDHEALRNALVVSFRHQYNARKVFWPKAMKASSRARIAGQPGIVHRLRVWNSSQLYTRNSQYVRISNTTGGVETVTAIGKGLFSYTDYAANDIVAHYSGEWITLAEAQRRDSAGRGGYMLKANTTDPLSVLDCYSQWHNNKCFASAANSATQLYSKADPQSRRKVVKNVDLIVSRVQGVKLKAITAIPSNTEIITSYGGSYRYPT
jgi:hypothetical protein